MIHLPRRSLAPLLISLAFAAVAAAEPTQQQYDDALRQLQQSQDRKSQLADENNKLKQRIAELEQQLRSVEASERTYFLRAHYAAWRTFIDRYPLLLRRFQAYLNNGNSGLSGATTGDEAAGRAEPAAFFDADWPFSEVQQQDASTTAPADGGGR